VRAAASNAFTACGSLGSALGVHRQPRSRRKHPVASRFESHGRERSWGRGGCHGQGGERFFVVPPLGEPYTASQKGKSDL
jgi:hypothetical protein